MKNEIDQYRITSLGELRALYGESAPPSMHKEIDYLHPHYRRFIEAAPFAVLATVGMEGVDVSPKGDPSGFIRIADEKTLLLPDRRGNNRIDGLSNILQDARVALLFMIPGIGETLRVNGRAEIRIDPDLLQQFAMGGKQPRSVLRIQVDAVFFHCSRAILRSGLWQAERQVDRRALPSLGTILHDLSNAQIDGTQYDHELPQRLNSTLY